ncbi:hypothetical protein SAMN04488529_10175 [Clostridium gasigenes]|uniref:Uncharacterized protein n=1 Tax=Clostridium gasigenes TaxID=94869 RepID=A0A1H0LEU8_9CLOT|nr:hypothetical protein SAMN04488529_10175 [Clostridium gasigenes]
MSIESDILIISKKNKKVMDKCIVISYFEKDY